MIKKVAVAFCGFSLLYATPPIRFEASTSFFKRVNNDVCTTAEELRDQAVTLGVGCLFLPNANNGFNIRFEQSIITPSLPDRPSSSSSSEPTMRRTKDFKSFSISYLHWFSGCDNSSWFIGSDTGLNFITQDTNDYDPFYKGPGPDRRSRNLRVSFLSGYQIGRQYRFELHLGLPYSGIGLVYQF
ncbi:MAG TPA: hypothetical protein PKL14_04565 [Holophaga sp.]|nr:hypothetical protein [Holophaga sp.]